MVKLGVLGGVPTRQIDRIPFSVHLTFAVRAARIVERADVIYRWSASTREGNRHLATMPEPLGVLLEKHM